MNDALFWLRTSIDTLDSEAGDLGSLLGTFRYRIEPQLKACGITLDWKMDDLSMCTLASEHHLQVVRIVQEAVTNVFKHAKASQLAIHTRVKDENIYLSITDNGCGISGDKMGHGLKNMHERITLIGGSMHITTPEVSGTSLVFTLPV